MLARHPQGKTQDGGDRCRCRRDDDIVNLIPAIKYSTNRAERQEGNFMAMGLLKSPIRSVLESLAGARNERTRLKP